MNEITEKARQIIREAITPNGINASSYNVDNYNRIWSRDSVMSGIAGVFINDPEIISAFKNSILTLSQYQHETGIIPSNVSIVDEKKPLVSYVTLTGRTDATTWWIIGTLVLLKNFPEFELQYGDVLKRKIEKAINVLQIWELNNKGLLYSPLGGNWADEYVISGYTLYDNVLYLRSLELAGDFLNSPKFIDKSNSLRELLKINFDNQNDIDLSDAYHPKAIQKRKLDKREYFSASLFPNGFDQRWDMAGNALALLFGLFDNKEPLIAFLNKITNIYDTGLPPVFYPIIMEEDRDWRLLEENYLYEFKNKPFQFHNGGFWPIFSGWLCAGLRNNNLEILADHILNSYEKVLTNSDYQFYEYHDIRNGQGKGVSKLCFSAAGYIFMTTENIRL